MNTRAILSLAALGAVLATSACKKKDNYGADSTAAGTAAMGDTSAAGSTAGTMGTGTTGTVGTTDTTGAGAATAPMTDTTKTGTYPDTTKKTKK
jgi:hypothetical protein